MVSIIAPPLLFLYCTMQSVHSFPLLEIHYRVCTVFVDHLKECGARYNVLCNKSAPDLEDVDLAGVIYL